MEVYSDVHGEHGVIDLVHLYAAVGHESPVFFNGMVVPSGKLGGPFFFFYPVSLLWRSTPAVLIGLLAALAAFARRLQPFSEPQARRTVTWLLFSVFLFTVLMNFGSKKFDRYLLPVYPPLDLIAGVGWVAIAQWFQSRKPGFLHRYSVPLILSAAIGVQMLGALGSHPYYLTYYNPLMGGARKAPQVMMIGWGEGLDQAARYFNQKPDAGEIEVASWYRGSFSYFFPGETIGIPALSEISDNWLEDLLDADYAVVYIQQWQRGTPRSMLDILDRQEPEHSIWINGLEYVRIYKLGIDSPTG